MNSIAWVYLPFFAFLGLVIAGLHYKNTWVIVAGIVFFCLYDVKPELKIICSRTVYNKFEFNTEKKGAEQMTERFTPGE